MLWLPIPHHGVYRCAAHARLRAGARCRCGVLSRSGGALFAVRAFQRLSRVEGITPALESSHAVAHVIKVAPTLPKESVVIVNLSGRGDKDVARAAEYLLAKG
jgi:tryptophan synthase beta subunit